MVAPYFSGPPHVHRWMAPAFHYDSTTLVPTSFLSESAKVIAKEPAFIKGKFLIKPYEARSTVCRGYPETLTNHYRRPSDGAVLSSYVELSDCCRTQSLSGINTEPPLLSAEQNLAVQNALGKIGATSWDAALDLAEIGDTIGLIGQAAKALASPTKLPKLVKDLVKTVPQGKHEYGFKEIKRDARNGSKEAANAWLTWRYGVMPTVLSIQDCIETLKKDLERASNRIRTKRRRPAVVKTWSKKDGTFVQAAQYIHSWSSRIEAIAYYQRTVNFTLQQQLGFGPEKLPELLWELTRLSFVFDWFFHVGDFLGALRPKVGVKVLGTSVSVKHEGRHKVFQKITFHGGQTAFVSHPYSVDVDNFKRTVNPQVVIPAFTGLDEVTVPRWLDAASLALNPSLALLNRNAPTFGRTKRNFYGRI